MMDLIKNKIFQSMEIFLYERRKKNNKVSRNKKKFIQLLLPIMVNIMMDANEIMPINNTSERNKTL